MSSLSYTSTPTYDVNDELNEEMEIFGREDEEEQLEDEEEVKRADSVPPKTEYLRPASSKLGSQAWSGRTETESVSIADVKSQSQTGSSQPTETTVRFASDSPSIATPVPSHLVEANLISRPDTARYGFHLRKRKNFWEK